MENNESSRYDDYKASDWYNADAMNALNRRLEGYSTDYATLKKQAEAEYAPTHRAELDALDARLASQTMAAQNQRQALGQTYERQRRRVDASYDRSAAALNNALNARGLGRSSLTATQGAYLEGQRNQALGDIDRAETDEIAAINSRIAQLADETARSRQTLAASYAQQLDNRINQLRSSNQTAAVSLQLQIAALQQQGYEAYQNWLLKERAQSLDEAEFRQRYGLNEDGTRRASSGSSAKAKTSATPAKKKNTLSSLVKGVAGGVRAAVSGSVRNMGSIGSAASGRSSGGASAGALAALRKKT